MTNPREDISTHFWFIHQCGNVYEQLTLFLKMARVLDQMHWHT